MYRLELFIFVSFIFWNWDTQKRLFTALFVDIDAVPYIADIALHIPIPVSEMSNACLFVFQRCGTKCQIINLGCGFDTLYWKLKDSTQAVGNFIELDFPSVVAKKSHIIKRNKQLLEKISNEG